LIPSRPPAPGTVLRYSYLWRRQAEAGRDEGEKDRPVALVIAQANDECVVVPITHSAPEDRASAVPLSDTERARLGLDGEQCWIVTTEINVFVWPGPDLRAVPRKQPKTAIYGKLSKGTFAEVLRQLQARARLIRVVRRGQ
jgi:hypothetical protein